VFIGRAGSREQRVKERLELGFNVQGSMFNVSMFQGEKNVRDYSPLRGFEPWLKKGQRAKSKE